MVLIGRAAASLRRRARLYVSLILAAIALQAIVYHIWHADAALFAGELVVTSLASAIVYAATQNDVDGAPAEAFWTRALERAWAVIAISFVQSVVQGVAMATILQGDFGSRLLGVAVLMMGLTFIFADVDAVVSDDESLLMLIPRAFSNSIRASWTGSTMIRIIAIFLVQLAFQWAAAVIQPELAHLHVPDAAFWATIPLGAILLVPLDIFTVYVYFDAIGYESKRTCGE